MSQEIVTIDKYYKREDEFNVLKPVDTIMQWGDIFVPAANIVRIDPDDPADVYQPDTKNNPYGYAPTGHALQKFAMAGGISFENVQRIDDGKDVNVAVISVSATLTLPDGQTVTVPGTKEIDAKLAGSTYQQKQQQKHKLRLAETGAMNAAIRKLLNLKSTYTKEELKKPFVLPRIVLNPNHPEVRTLMIQKSLFGKDALFALQASQESPKSPEQLQSGTEQQALPEQSARREIPADVAEMLDEAEAVQQAQQASPPSLADDPPDTTVDDWECTIEYERVGMIEKLFKERQHNMSEQDLEHIKTKHSPRRQAECIAFLKKQPMKGG